MRCRNHSVPWFISKYQGNTIRYHQWILVQPQCCFIICIRLLKVRHICSQEYEKQPHAHTHFYTNVLVLKYAVILSQSLYMTPVWCLNRWLDIGCARGWWGGISGCRVISHDRNHISPPPCSSCSGPRLDSTACVIRQKSMARVHIHCVCLGSKWGES